VTVLLDQNDRARPEQVADLPIVTPRGTTVKLGQVAEITTVSGPTHVDRHNRKRSVSVTSYLDGRASGDVAKDIDTALAGFTVPTGYKVAQGGDAQDQGEAFGQIFTALGLSMVLMYLLMVVLFGSLLYPLIIMLSLPLAVVGAFGLLALTGNTLNIMSMIGLILLTGLVGKNAILMVDYTNHLRQRGMDRNEALLKAGPTRLRPILMTTSALILAMLPLAMRLGEGSEWRAPTAVTVIGGLLTSTLLTLVMIPAVYTLMDDLQTLVVRVFSWTSRKLTRSGESAAEPVHQPTSHAAPRQQTAGIPVTGGSD
jgi:HAE1 family hydrophobic/amphiphilic exporter-1